MRRYIAEAIGTFVLVFFGTGSVIVNDLTGGAITQTGIAFAFGFSVFAMIPLLGNVHMNPAVSIALVVGHKFDVKELAPFITSQLSGALVASFILKILFPQSITLGATIPSGSQTQSFVLELILTFILLFVIMMVASVKRNKVISAIPIASVVGLEALFAGPVSGASMNPARSIAPAIASGNLQSLWIYILAPVAGAIIGVLAFRLIQSKPIKTK